MEQNSVEDNRRMPILTTTFKYLNNLTSHLLNSNNSILQKLHTHYTHLARTMSGNVMEVPEKQFSTSTMCSHCSAVWRPGTYIARILPTKRRNVNLKTDAVSAGCNQTSSRKKIKKVKQKMHLLCNNCKKSSVVKLRKPKIMKPVKMVKKPVATQEVRKKKKKQKEKFNSLSILRNLDQSQKHEGKVLDSAPKLNVTKSSVQKKKQKKTQTKITSVQKVALINKMKLEGVLGNDLGKKKKSKLGSFLNELF